MQSPQHTMDTLSEGKLVNTNQTVNVYVLIHFFNTVRKTLFSTRTLLMFFYTYYINIRQEMAGRK